MKLSQEVIQYIYNVVQTANSLGIENVIIEPNMVRAINEACTVVINHDDNVPDMEVGSISISRISAFLSRYNIAKSMEEFTVDAAVSDNGVYVKLLQLSSKGTKIDYRCGDPQHSRAPRKINDTLSWEVDLNPDAVSLLQKGAAAMGSDNVTIISNKDGVSFEMVDVNNDIFKHTFADNVRCLTDDTNDLFAFSYPTKVIVALFKNDQSGKFSIGAKGILKFLFNNITIYVLPQV